ncbi:hypothetical protein [Microbispora sp. H13382]|nr:hypothetical protein [Microbispora sp. H13382]
MGAPTTVNATAMAVAALTFISPEQPAGHLGRLTDRLAIETD